VAAIDYLWGFFRTMGWAGRRAHHHHLLGNTYTGFRLNRQYFVVGQYSGSFVPRPPGQTISSGSGCASAAECERVGGRLRGDQRGRGAARVRFELGAAALRRTVQPVTTGAADQWRPLTDITLDQPRFVANLPPNSITTLVR
jgi:hypothetical protein